MSNEDADHVASADTIAVAAPAAAKPTGLHSPPDSNNAMKLDGSDSELSDLDDALADLQPDGPPIIPHLAPPADLPAEPQPNPDDDDIGPVLPAEWSGSVPVFRPTMVQFRDFKRFVCGAQYPLPQT